MSESNDFPPVLTITEKAAAAIREVIASQQVPEGFFLRVGIRGGGCAGPVNYMMGFDSQKETDQRYDVGEFKVLIDAKHAMHVMGMEIDWHEEGDQRGFVFNNPSRRVESMDEVEE